MDGLPLEGWFIPADSDRLVICNHFGPANRQGYPGHLEPWNTYGGIEVNFLPKYKALRNAGYNVLAYDLRNHGLSSSGNGGISGVGMIEWRDVIGSIRYAKSRADTSRMKTSLQSLCIGCNSTFVAMRKHPDEFEHISSLIAIQPVVGHSLIERSCETAGVENGVELFDQAFRKMTGFRVDDYDMRRYAKDICVPTFVVHNVQHNQVRFVDSRSVRDEQT